VRTVIFAKLVATARAAAAVPAAGTFAGQLRPGTGRSKGGEFFVQLGRTAMRAFGPQPIRRTHQDFAVAFALPAMKFIDWHAKND